MYTAKYQDTQLSSADWLITLRWYYAPIAFLLALFMREETGLVNAEFMLTASFVVVFAVNLIFFFLLRSIAGGVFSREAIQALLAGQIVLDLSFFFVVLLTTGGGAESIGHFFFLFPIAVSMLFFGPAGLIVTAVLSGILIFLSVLFNAGMFLQAGVITIDPIFTPVLLRALVESGIISFLYLFGGLFAISLFQQLRSHDVALLSAITDMVHQLRTPLSGLKWTFKILLDEDAGKDTEEERELLAKGSAANERMITLVNDVLAVARLESGKFTYHFIPVHIELLIEETIKSLALVAEAKEIRLNFVAPKHPLPEWKVDPEKMRDVLQNLISNAIKYTRVKDAITLNAEVKENHLHIQVEDNGIGISDTATKKIFTRFFRAENAIAVEADGSGLGLFIAQNIVHAHHGKIWFEHAASGGTVFHVLLPKRP